MESLLTGYWEVCWPTLNKKIPKDCSNIYMNDEEKYFLGPKTLLIFRNALLLEQIKLQLPGLILRINYADDSRKTWQTINKVTSGEPNNLAINQLYYKGGKAEAVPIFVVLPCPEQSEQLV